MRFATLYFRSRRVPAAVATAMVSTEGLGALSLAVKDPQLTLMLTVLAAVVGICTVGPGLTSTSTHRRDCVATAACHPRRRRGDGDRRTSRRHAPAR